MRLAAALFAALSLLFAGTAYAQFDVSSFAPPLTIVFSPQYPQPGQTVQLSLGGGTDLSSASVVWKESGTTIAQGATASVVAGALGSETPIEADVTMLDGTTQTAQATLSPTQIDLLVESDSYTPPFYLGRALPGAGTDLIVQALPRFVDTNGSLIQSADLVYTWKEGGQVLGSISGAGKSNVVIPVQHMYATVTITVDVRSRDGTLAGEASVSIPPVQPFVLLYEDHPRFGILYNAPLASATAISDAEMTFSAAPFFAQAANPNDPALSYAWTVNGTAITPSTNDASEVTLNAQNSAGQAEVGLEVTHATNFYLDISGLWQVSLSSSGAANTPFHTQ